MLVGYARVSALDPDPRVQLRALRARGCKRIFIDRCSCRQARRPQRDAALKVLRPNDALVVWRFDRLARSTPEMLALAAQIRQRGCELVSLRDAVDTGSSAGSAVFAVMEALGRLDADLRGERARESHRACRDAGKAWGRRPAFRDPARVRAARSLLADPAIPRAAVARRLGIARSTLYHWFPKGDADGFIGGRTQAGGAE